MTAPCMHRWYGPCGSQACLRLSDAGFPRHSCAVFASTQMECHLPWNSAAPHSAVAHWRRLQRWLHSQENEMWSNAKANIGVSTAGA
jgi:hypothetical protein